jgi:hypothetical protein
MLAVTGLLFVALKAVETKRDVIGAGFRKCHRVVTRSVGVDSDYRIVADRLTGLGVPVDERLVSRRKVDAVGRKLFGEAGIIGDENSAPVLLSGGHEGLEDFHRCWPVGVCHEKERGDSRLCQQWFKALGWQLGPGEIEDQKELGRSG